MFSFDLQEDADLSIWTILQKTIPSGYRIPDFSFLSTLHPNLSKELIESKDWLLPDKWRIESLVRNTLPDLPHGYRIPDLMILKRMFDAL